jgi:hypothetical protein
MDRIEDPAHRAVLALRAAGHTRASVGAAVGISPQQVGKVVKHARDRLSKADLAADLDVVSPNFEADLEKACRVLSPRQQQVFTLATYIWRPASICEHLQITGNAARSNLSQAKKAVVRAMSHSYDHAHERVTRRLHRVHFYFEGCPRCGVFAMTPSDAVCPNCGSRPVPTAIEDQWDEAITARGAEPVLSRLWRLIFDGWVVEEEPPHYGYRLVDARERRLAAMTNVLTRDIIDIPPQVRSP